MKVLSIRDAPFSLSTIVDATGRRMGEGRAEGLHLMEIVHDLELRLQPDKYKGKPPMSEEVKSLLMQLGFGWERTLFEQHKDILMVPGEQQKDGIWLNPDALNTADGYLEEFKLTFKSAGRLASLERDFWGWLVQSKAYCHALGTRFVRFRVCFVDGDYKRDPWGPMSKVIELEYGQRELEENWAMLLRHAQNMLREREQQSSPTAGGSWPIRGGK